MLLQRLIATTFLVSLTACGLSLDDPTGAKARRAEERRAECQQVNIARETMSTEAMRSPFQPTDVLTMLALEDKNLQILSSEIAARLQLLAEAEHHQASFADIERTITSANDRSEAHQASVVERGEAWSDYAGVSYALEHYCNGSDAQYSSKSFVDQGE